MAFWNEVAQVELPLLGQPAPIIETAKICLVDDVTDLRTTTEDWSAWGSNRPLFNWTSVFNFNADQDNLVFALICSHPDCADALMLVRDDHIVKCDSGHRAPLVYVGFLEVAPWNQPTAVGRIYQGLGPIMLRIACELSLQRGYGGRLGLHSVAGAETFYARLGFRRLDCPSEHHEVYYELDESGAEALLRDQGDAT